MLNNQELSLKRQRLLHILFRFRSMTINQICEKFAPVTRSESELSLKQNTYPILRELTSMKLVVTETAKVNNRSVNCYSLSEAGLQYYYNLRDIPPGYIGKGFGSDYGEFPYELQRPPKNNLLHQLMMTDVFLKIDSTQDKYPDLMIDHRDNRYSSVEYTMDGKQYRFRPDGEIRVGDKCFLVEVDRGTEYLEALKLKFLGYRRYFDWCMHENKRIHDGVFFITRSEKNNGFNRRWFTVQNAFMSQLSSYFLNFNLTFGTISDIERLIINEFDISNLYNKAPSIIRKYVNVEKGIGDLMILDPRIFQCDPTVFYNWVNVTGKPKKLIAYYRFEGHETRAITRLFEFYKIMCSRHQEKFYFQPVFLHSEGPIIEPRFHGFEEEPELVKVFGNVLWLRINEGHHQWTNSKGEKLMTDNPLLL